MTLEAHSLQITRATRPLLDTVSAIIEPGRVHAVLGPNGAGKTTLLRCLSGELAPTAGQVLLDGRALAQWSPTALARRRAVITQGDSLRFAFPVSEVVRLGRLPLPRLADREETARIDAVLDETGCTALRDRPYTDLSGGERQRVQLARALLQVLDDLGEGPRYLLLDEPTSALDLSHQHALLKTLRRRAENGLGVLLTLHDPNLALAYADRVTLLCYGQALMQGDPAEVLTPEALERFFGVRATRVQRADGRWHLMVEGPVEP